MQMSTENRNLTCFINPYFGEIDLAMTVHRVLYEHISKLDYVVRIDRLIRKLDKQKLN